ncbi:large conductance mechanosensitive channel protein MscL [Bifidobacterium crudilactis]|jgi:large conductance mechanosensitive channel|uniref:Large-conductance mechanosensitive channel n=1 Tax=Bifidobacterium crudilactis TaxID=327277 RepID=A0A971ICF6_9BIFI|nr:large conductance mechanosensitive channel protein MscL [Bifidobacterium crudilactis]MCI1664275.1 large conductance mechanosensitive channel protein MscL [Bifidobacterium crudilactis]MCI1868438.1 large conductance mechanosensitive channel protein MscL [Bifidobacterium crudilactis]MDN5972024.1 large conductance mechanosensitive channel protein MscL [Bifidobacterium crudilactis]MDN6001092.1 large conductance mechanosensitive channel protein MscL [Bifidobacterium crudilactis]MDN6208669.1 large
MASRSSSHSMTDKALNASQQLSALTDKGPLGGFKKFISRGSMVDMAVGVVMGSAVTAVVNSIVKSFISPLIAMIFGKADMSKLLTLTYNGATISFGAIIGEIINFLIIAAAVYFCIILPINKLRDMTRAATGVEEEESPAEPSPEEQTVVLLQEIRDQLNNGSPSNPSAINPSLR